MIEIFIFCNNNQFQILIKVLTLTFNVDSEYHKPIESLNIGIGIGDHLAFFFNYRTNLDTKTREIKLACNTVLYNLERIIINSYEGSKFYINSCQYRRPGCSQFPQFPSYWIIKLNKKHISRRQHFSNLPYLTIVLFTRF